MSCYLNINAYLKIVKLKIRNKNWKRWEKKYKKILSNSFFLMTRPCLIIQALLLLVKKEAVKRLLKLHKK